MARSRIASAYIHGWLVLPIVTAVVVLLPVPARFVEAIYARDMYPWWQAAVTWISNLVPFALLDVMIVTATSLVIVRTVQLVRAAQTRGVLAAMWEGVRRLLRAGAVVVLAFFAMWGCHYRRLPLEQTIGVTDLPAPTQASLQLAIADANALGAALRPKLPVGEALTYEAAAEQLRGPMNDALASVHLEPLARPGRPKFSLLLTPFFTWAGVDGMINPLALESIVHPDLLPVERAFVLAHEWAHLAGEADEAEASAIGWLACMKGGPALAYSASLFLIGEAGAALPVDVHRKVFAKLDPGIRIDLELIAKRMRQQKPEVQRAAFQVYDEYLKANRVPDGTASYGRALTLILAPPLRDALSAYTPPARR